MEKLKFFIVDDDEQTLSLYSRLFRKNDNLELFLLKDGSEAVELAKTVRPDIAIMDFHMPIMTGLEATEHILGMHGDVFIIVLTGEQDKQLEEEMAEAGAVSFMRKPVNSRLLKSTINNFSSIKTRLSAESETEEERPAGYAQSPVQDEQVGKSIFKDYLDSGTDGYKVSASEMYKNMSSELKADIDEIHDAAEVLCRNIKDFNDSLDEKTIRECAEGFFALSRLINYFKEFPNISRSLHQIGTFLKEFELIDINQQGLKLLGSFLGDVDDDIYAWRKSIFIDMDSEDVHSFDPVMLGYAIQIESVFTDPNLVNTDREHPDAFGEVELF